MTAVTTTFEHAGTDPSATPLSSASAQKQALFTEQLVFSTAAAVALPPAKTRRFSDAVHTVAGAVHAWLVSAAQPPARRRYPKRHVWLENSLMSREMDRL
jgi:hypothetical protein